MNYELGTDNYELSTDNYELSTDVNSLKIPKSIVLVSTNRCSLPPPPQIVSKITLNQTVWIFLVHSKFSDSVEANCLTTTCIKPEKKKIPQIQLHRANDNQRTVHLTKEEQEKKEAAPAATPPTTRLSPRTQTRPRVFGGNRNKKKSKSKSIRNPGEDKNTERQRRRDQTRRPSRGSVRAAAYLGRR